MRAFTASWIAAAVAALAAPAAAQVIHTFDSDNQGWTIADIAAAPGTGSAATWNASQRIQTADVAPWTTFSAPTPFLGDLSHYADGLFAFDLRDASKDADADSFATFGILGANGQVLYWFGGSPSTSFMTTFAATLGTGDSRWRLNANPGLPASGSAPTAQVWADVLGNVAAIRINADWHTGGDFSELDNVQLIAAVPEPQTYALMALGLAAVAGVARRRRA